MTKSKKIILIITSIVLVLLIAGGIFYNYLKTPRFTTDHFTIATTDSFETKIEHISFTDQNQLFPNVNFSINKINKDLTKDKRFEHLALSYNTSTDYCSLANFNVKKIQTLFENLYTGKSEIKAELISKTKYLYTVYYSGYGIRRDNGNREIVDFIVIHNLEPLKNGSVADFSILPVSEDDKFSHQYLLYLYRTTELSDESIDLRINHFSKKN